MNVHNTSSAVGRGKDMIKSDAEQVVQLTILDSVHDHRGRGSVIGGHDEIEVQDRVPELEFPVVCPQPCAAHRTGREASSCQDYDHAIL